MAEKYLTLSREDRLEALGVAATNSGRPVHLLEKDIWVVWAIDALFLTPVEVDSLINAAKRNRWGHRDATMILVAYRHGFRPSELIDLQWDQIDFTHPLLPVLPAKTRTPP